MHFLKLFRPYDPPLAQPKEQRGFQAANTIRAGSRETDGRGIFEIDSRARDFTYRRAGPNDLSQHLCIKGEIIHVLFQGQFLDEIALTRKSPKTTLFH